MSDKNSDGMEFKRAIWWIRRDFRLTDNTALMAAAERSEAVIPVFVFDDTLTKSDRVRGPRLAWMLDGLEILKDDLKAMKAELVFQRGADTVAELLKVVKEAEADAVFFNRDYSPYAKARDSRAREELEKLGVAVHDFKDLIIHESGEFESKSGKPFAVYSPYRNIWREQLKPAELGKPKQGKLIAADLKSEPIPTAESLGVELHEAPYVQPGEANAIKQLDQFIGQPLFEYKDKRNIPAEPGTSVISMYLRWGMLSPRMAYHAGIRVMDATSSKPRRESVNKWIDELVWREFNYELLQQFPEIAKKNYRSEFDGLNPSGKPELLEAWKQGRTGYPIVDAGMRQMLKTGWMHNRLRLITASFLVKDLLIDWREGEPFFMQQLLCGDLAVNAGNWQWTAGTGTDAAPYFRIFNPALQAEKFDPNGDFVREYVPELKDVPTEFIHEPSKMAQADQVKYNCILGKDYPLPIVDHAVQRKLALEMYEKARRAP